MSQTADSSPRGSNSPSPYPYQGHVPNSAERAAASSAGPSFRPNLVDTEMEDRSESPADFAVRTGTALPRPPPSPSSTSQSDDGAGPQDFADLASIDDADNKDNSNDARSFDPAAVKLSRRGTLIPASPTSSNGTWILQNAPRNHASDLPHEILLHIFKYLVLYPPDLLSCLLVCKSWCLNGVELLWHRPALFKISSLFKLVGVIRKPEQLFPYANFVRRLNFTLLSSQLEDQLFLMMSACTRLERLTLAGCSNITDATLCKVFQNTPHLVAIDLTDVADVTDATLLTLAANCPKAQGINLTGCKEITSRGIVALAKRCKWLRRVKLCGCENVDDEALLALTQHCSALLEVDLIHCSKVSDRSVREIWTRCYQMRDLRLAHCSDLTDNAFPSARGTTGVSMLGTTHAIARTSSFPTETSAPTSRGASPGIPSIPSDLSNNRLFDHLRILDLTSCTSLSDTAVEGIVANVPRLKNLALTKCTRLTDESLYSIAKLGKNLHYLHLGHVSNITDRAVTHLARSCTRLRYIDVACCPNLTDLSVTEIAHNMPKLRRIGLVKVVNLTDQAIYGLVDRYNCLERIHLSYCENVSVPAIFIVLQRLSRLTHLSLTGVPAFRRPELQKFCRAPPKDFNEHQRQAFCVYSGKGVHDLRKYLQQVYSDEQLAAEFGGLEGRVRGILGGLGQTQTHAHAPAQTVSMGAPVENGNPTPIRNGDAVGVPVGMGTAAGGTRRVGLSAAEQMYYDQQRELARFANARRAAADASLLNRPGSTDGARGQALVAQAARNPGLPLVGPVNGDGRDPDVYYTRGSRRPEVYYGYPVEGGGEGGVEPMQQDEPLHPHNPEGEGDEAEGDEVYGTPEASQELAADDSAYLPRFGN